MPTEEDSAFSNPVAPSGAHFNENDDADLGALTNDDFRKLLMTPRQVPGVAPPTKARLHVPREYNENDDAALRRQKKKKYYAKLKKEEEEREKELADRYRDRARERRDGVNPDYQQAESSTTGTSKTAEYRAVAPTSDGSNTAAERRRLEIQESKFLGGDMEHTHLVKGLDFALLQKVRSEIANIDSENPEKEVKSNNSKKDQAKIGVEFKTASARKIHKALFDNKPPRRNELFAPGRMAYIFELEEDEYAETDIPTTSIRSKADCPVMEMQTTLTTNDIVISKLTQILSYLRQGVRARKMRKKEASKGRLKEETKMIPDESIYGDFEIGTTSKRRSKQQKPSKYFDDPITTEDDQKRPSVQSVRDMIKDVNDKFNKKKGPSAWDDVRADQQNRSRGHTSSKQNAKKAVPDSYAECYPGAIEMADAANDSDDEPDYTQMDMGNKKGPVKRWDFETEEEYNTYMESREAMPKAAFQFGIKMAEGRKTRTRGGHMDEKQKLDRQWQKISKIISKRKGGDEGGDAGKRRKDY